MGESTDSHVPATASELPACPGYEMLSEIGRSVGSIVYLARDTSLKNEVAIKMPGTLAPREADTESKFVRAAQITAKLQHSGIPPIFHLGTLSDGRPFLVMKLVKGRSLAEMLAERPKPLADRIRFLSVFEQTCQTIAYAHTQGVIHRNLKPRHVMIDAFGQVQVIGWRSAGLVPREEPALSDRPPSGSLQGTPTCMAPEQARGQWDKVNCRTDVFMLGGILIEILTGLPTFHAGDSDAELIGKAAAGDLSEAFARLDRCGEDAELIALAKRCLSPNPAYRPADAGELATLISAYRGSLDERVRKSEAEQFAATAIANEKGKRKQAQLALILVVGLFIIWTGALIWWQDRHYTVRRILEKEREAEEKQVRDLRVPQIPKRQPPDRTTPPKNKTRKQMDNPIPDEHIAPPPREANPDNQDEHIAPPPREIDPSIP